MVSRSSLSSFGVHNLGMREELLLVDDGEKVGVLVLKELIWLPTGLPNPSILSVGASLLIGEL